MRLILVYLLTWWVRWLLRHEATSLHLEPHMSTKLNFGDGVGSVTAAVITPKTAGGNAAAVKQVTWTTSDANVLTLTPADPASDDFTFNTSCKVQSGAVGTATLTVTAITKGGVTLTESADFEVVADEEATSLGLAVG